VAALLWESRKVRGKHGKQVMKLSAKVARQIIDRVGTQANAATFVAETWGCFPESKGSSVLGKTANRWFMPDWCDGREERISVLLTPLQKKKWDHRAVILLKCSDESNPAAKRIREALKKVKPCPEFLSKSESMTEQGKRDVVKAYLANPDRYNITVDGDIQSYFSRLPSELRTLVRIADQESVELDIQSAHAHLLGIFYAGEKGVEWAAEYDKFKAEATMGFPSLYGEGKVWKIAFLSALNQKTHIARNASDGYKKLEELFPLMAGKIRAQKMKSPKAVGRILRCALSKIVEKLVLENHAESISTIPVTDSAVVSVPSDLRREFSAIFRTAWRLAIPLSQQSGTDPLIRASNGEKFHFHL
jgi:hypothetical protein